MSSTMKDFLDKFFDLFR